MPRLALAGLSHLTVRVAEMLLERGIDVVVVADDHHELLDVLPEGTTRLARRAPWITLFEEADLAGCECLLVLSEDDLENLRVVAAAHDAAPDVPVVLRAFDARLVEQFQVGMNVRRCYSASALAAPAFVAGVFAEEVVETLRLADDEVPLCVLRLRADSPLVGLTAGEMKTAWSCAAVAREAADGSWEPALGDHGLLEQGDKVLVGGLLLDVLRLASRNSEILSSRRRWRPIRRTSRHRSPERTRSLVAVSALALAVLLVGTIAVFALALDLGPVDATYKALTNAFGDVGLDRSPQWLKVFGVSVMVGGAVLIGVVLAHLTAVLTASRLEQQAGRRARRMRGHVVIAGLGVLGYRVDRLLDELGLDTVIIEQTNTSRFREAAAFHTPVLSGDARLSENLERAGIREASCIVACTDNDLVNVSASVQALQLNPSIRTIARIFDDDLADRLSTFGIDVALSMSSASASAFVGAATDERAVRRLQLDELSLIAFRYEVERRVDADEVTGWREQGLRILAVQPRDEPPQPPTAALTGLDPATVMIVAGPAPVLERCLFGVSSAAPRT
jgi:Trk K+ transport system NAD-binding subunit